MTAKNWSHILNYPFLVLEGGVLTHPRRPPHKIVHEFILRTYLTLVCGGLDKS